MAQAARGSLFAFVMAALLFLGTLAGAAQAGSQRDALAQARHDLVISEQVLARLTRRVETARESPATRSEERARLDEYLARVRKLVELNRERVRNLERQVADQPAGTAGSPEVAQPVAAMTEAEQVAMLDGKLNDSLEAFDKLLLDEARKARTHEAETGATNGGSGGSANRSSNRSGKRAAGSRNANSGGDASTGSEQGAGESRDSGSESASRGGRNGTTRGGSPGGPVGGSEHGAAGPDTASTPPPDVGDGNDDDIVARQIRKAAEAESDPELRNKLWDEYRKYKQGTSQGASG